MCETIWAAIIAGSLGVGGTILGAIVANRMSREASFDAIEASNRNAINIINRQEFNQAAAEFRDTFAEAQRLLAKHYTYEVAVDNEKPSVFEILDKFFIDHERAMRRFRHYLDRNIIPGFDKAWKTYCCYDDWNIPLLCYSQKGDNDPEVAKEFMNRANVHLNNLLKYAKPLQD